MPSSSSPALGAGSPSARCVYATALHADPSATLDDLREAVTTLEEIERIARRVFGGSNPLTTGIAFALRVSRDSMAARTNKTPPPDTINLKFH